MVTSGSEDKLGVDPTEVLTQLLLSSLSACLGIYIKAPAYKKNSQIPTAEVDSTPLQRPRRSELE